MQQSLIMRRSMHNLHMHRKGSIWRNIGSFKVLIMRSNYEMNGQRISLFHHSVDHLIGSGGIL